MKEDTAHVVRPIHEFLIPTTSTHCRVLVSLAVCLCSVQPADADDFRLTIGNPIAVIAPATSASSGAPPFKKNGAVFVVRTDGCADRAKATIEGTAEGILNGRRSSVPLVLITTPTPGVYAVNRTWPIEGVWVTSLVAACEGLKAGAIVPIALSSNSFVRESSKFFSRPATPAEVDGALKVHSASATKSQ